MGCLKDSSKTSEVGRLVAVVVTYQRLPQLRATLARLLETSPSHLDKIWVVDNASTDGTAAWLAEQSDPRLLVHTLP
ncbi:MAG TPA: glycosyltransferase [Rhodobacterales bacterium]|nr:glycosyltransferase [Rhodobacterales bacterium]